MNHPLPKPISHAIPAVVNQGEQARRHFGSVIEALSAHDPEDYDTLEAAMIAIRHLVAWVESAHAAAPAGSAVQEQLQLSAWAARHAARRLKQEEAAMIARDERGD